MVEHRNRNLGPIRALRFFVPHVPMPSALLDSFGIVKPLLVAKSIDASIVEQKADVPTLKILWTSGNPQPNWKCDFLSARFVRSVVDAVQVDPFTVVYFP